MVSGAEWNDVVFLLFSRHGRGCERVRLKEALARYTLVSVITFETHESTTGRLRLWLHCGTSAALPEDE